MAGNFGRNFLETSRISVEFQISFYLVKSSGISKKKNCKKFCTIWENFEKIVKRFRGNYEEIIAKGSYQGNFEETSYKLRRNFSVIWKKFEWNSKNNGEILGKPDVSYAFNFV